MVLLYNKVVMPPMRSRRLTPMVKARKGLVGALCAVIAWLVVCVVARRVSRSWRVSVLVL